MSHNQYLIALDLDGTLLNREKEIDTLTKKILQKLMRDGHIVVISTGRPHRGSIQYYRELGLDTPMINFNGALIHHPTDKRWDILHNPMPKRTALEIAGTCQKIGVHNIVAEVMDQVYLDHYDKELTDIFHMAPNDPPFTIGSLQNELKSDPTSLLIHPIEDNIDTLRMHLDRHHAEVIEHRKWGAPWNIIEVVKKGMNKAVGLKKVAHYYQIPHENIIAFGDEDNDLEMIEYAGVGVAMGNAIDELKQIATDITWTNEDDGVGIFLKKYFNIATRAI